MKSFLLLSAVCVAMIGCDNRPVPEATATPSPSPVGTPMGGAPMSSPPATGTQDQSLVTPADSMPATTPAPSPATP